MIGVAFLLLDVLFECLARIVAILVVRHFGARRANNPGRIGQLARELAVKERGKEFAFREVPGAAEDNVVKRIDGNDLAAHGVFLCAIAKIII